MTRLKAFTLLILLLFSFVVKYDNAVGEPGCFPAKQVFPGPFFPQTSAEDFELVTGKWWVMASGRIFTLDIVDASDPNNVKIILSSGEIENATFDKFTGRLTFTRVIESIKLRQKWVGYVMTYDKGGPEKWHQADPKWRIAGTVDQSHPKIDRPNSGWYATLDRQMPSEECADLEAHKIDFEIIPGSRDGFQGRVKVTGTVKNVGQTTFDSVPGQQEAYLYEIPPGGLPLLVARQVFEDLDPNNVAKVIYERDWDSSSPAEGEFPPSYRLELLYDPDIYIDGNPNNDDCNSRNNRMERLGEDINFLFRE